MDRYIPQRLSSDIPNFILNNEIDDTPYNTEIRSILIPKMPRNILQFHLPPRTNTYRERMYNTQVVVQRHREINLVPERILDAPDLIDDYYLNLLDWHLSSDILLIALKPNLYIWRVDTSDLLLSFLVPISGIRTSKLDTLVGIGTTNCLLEVWDFVARHTVRRLTSSHSQRIAALDWHENILASGSKNGMVELYDIRQADSILKLYNHSQEVCGMRWSPDGRFLATGGNDDLLNIWQPNHSATPLFSLKQHTAAVKAIAWCPWQDEIIASGGGTQDQTLRFWNCNTGRCINSIDTKSQVSAIIWSRDSKELVSSHGYTQNQLIVWKYPTMSKIAELEGHSRRILHMTQSPDGTTVATAAADETLRFWKVFEHRIRKQHNPTKKEKIR